MIDNPNCDCGTDHETPYSTAKTKMFKRQLIDTIELSFVASQTPIPDRVIHLKTILGYISHLPTEAQSDINAGVNSFFSCIKSRI